MSASSKIRYFWGGHTFLMSAEDAARWGVVEGQYVSDELNQRMWDEAFALAAAKHRGEDSFPA